MNIQQLSDQRDRLSKMAARRYVDRERPRESRLREVEDKGVLAAAGTQAAVRRTAHMSLSEGRGLLEGKTFEAIVDVDDSDSVNFLLRGTLAARAVCRLVVDRQPIGTGFLVAPGVLLTNNHVIRDAAAAADFTAEFDYEFTTEDQLRQPIVRFRLSPERLFATSDAEGGLDFTFVAVKPTAVDGGAKLDAFGWIPLDPRRDKILEGEPAVIVQHPRGEPKRLCLFSAELVDRLEQFLHYTTDTDGGSSGSPVFNRSWQLIGLHHAAAVADKHRRGHSIVVNEGVRVSSIIALLQGGGATVTGATAAALAAVTRPEVVGDGRPQRPRPEPRVPSERAARAELEATSIQTHAADHFRSRDASGQGYRPDFIGAGRLSVPLPRLPGFLDEDTAKLTDGSGASELTYTHFSVVLSASRRLPILTAANIDGPALQRLARTDRDFEAADRWYFDGRVQREAQLGPQVYDRTAFDFGHMVRREDPVWGDVNTARMANDDTFHMTNCAPQHHDLNTKTWLALENAMLASARAHGLRLSTFTGPVLSAEDPVVLGVQVPTAFWKVVAYPDRGRLRARGFMQWQTKLVEQVQTDLEALRELDMVREYQVPIREIARLTSIDFGPLIAADGSGRRRLDENVIGSLFPSADSRPDGLDTGAAQPAAAADFFAMLREMQARIAQLLDTRGGP